MPPDSNEEPVTKYQNRLLVCVGPSPTSADLIKETHRLADAAGAPWVALHLAQGEMTASQAERVDGHLALAKSLGAEVQKLSAPLDHREIEKYAASENIGRLVLGRPEQTPWFPWRKATLLEKLLSSPRKFDIVVPATSNESVGPREVKDRNEINLPAYLFAFLIVAASTAVSYPLASVLERSNEVIIYLTAVVIVSYLKGRGAAIFASVLSVIYFNFFFIPPVWTFKVADPQNILTLVGLVLVGWLVSDLTQRLRITALGAQQREKQAVALLSFTKELSKATTEEEVLAKAEEQLGKLDTDVSLHLNPPPGTEVGKTPQGWLPISGRQGEYGVLESGEEVLERAEEELLSAMVSQLASALDRIHLTQSALERDLLKESERLQSALLTSVTHDLRVPLVSINGALQSLLEEELNLSELSKRELIENALSESDRLTRFVTNLLQMSKMEAGRLKVKAVPCDPWDLVATTVESVQRRLGEREVKLLGAEDQPLVPTDFVLIQQVLINLLENSLQHGEGSITIGVSSSVTEVTFSVEDEGPPLGGETQKHIFERFSRGRDAADGGSGLGLSICKGLVEAHSGKIWVEEAKRFCFSLPLEDKN